MEARLTDKPVSEILAAIHELDIEPVKQRVMDAELGEGWTREYADSIGVAYKNYLMMLAKHQEHAEEIQLSKDVDEFWHTHILQTIKYTEDCERIFGTYLHHNPHVGARTQVDVDEKEVLAKKTQQLYEKEFGGEQKDVAAWAGTVTRDANPAWSSAAIRGKDAAWSSAAIQGKQAAWSSAAIRGKDAAWSSAAIQGKQAAWSSAAIRGKDAAWSSAAIQGKQAAWSSAAIRGKDAAWSSAAIQGKQAAWSSAAIRGKDAAWSSAAIQGKQAAWSSAAIRGKDSAWSSAAIHNNDVVSA